VVVSLSKECRPVCYAATHGAHLDEAEGFGAGVEPRRFAVVDLELEIGWDPNGLYGT
jgi:hypothetical protein